MDETPEVRTTSTYTQIQRLIAVRAGIALVRAWARLPTYNADRVEELAEFAGPSITAAQTAAVQVTASYLTTFTQTPIPPIPVIELPTVPDFKDPFRSFGKALNNGLSFEEARDAGAIRANRMGHDTIIQTADSFTEVVAETQPQIVGWRRVISGPTCDWCQDIAKVLFYRREDAARSRHENCDCILVAVTEAHDPGQILNAENLPDTVLPDKEPEYEFIEKF